jgi:uncharacterized membrane protein YvlD (DUF360 family)
MRRALVRWVINAVAIWAAIMVVPGLNADGGWTVYLWVALLNDPVLIGELGDRLRGWPSSWDW